MTWGYLTSGHLTSELKCLKVNLTRSAVPSQDIIGYNLVSVFIKQAISLQQQEPGTKQEVNRKAIEAENERTRSGDPAVL